MGKNSRTGPIPDFSDVRVRLKPLFGLRPGTWLSILYALLLLFLLFLLLVNPGLASAGTYYRFTTFPDGAAVHVDGRHAGSTPGEVLIKRGQRRVELLKPGYETVVLEEKVGGRVFGTLIVPPRKTVSRDLRVRDGGQLAAAALAGFAATPYIPSILLDTVKPVKTQPELAPRLSAFLQQAKYFVTDPEQLAALLAAQAYLDSGGDAADPEAGAEALTLEAVQKYIQAQANHDYAPYWALVTLPDELSRALSSSQEFQALHAAFLRDLQQALRPAGRPTAGGSPVTVAGLRFQPVPAGTLLQGRDDDPGSLRDRVDPLLPHRVNLPSFYMSETEVTNRQYADFLAENPDWRKNNLDDLVRRGVAAEGYLADWPGDGYPDGAASLPVTGVPYAAAEAYARWLASKLPAALSGWEPRLPYESEWEWAARGGLVGQPYPTGNLPEGSRYLSGGVEGPAPVGGSSPNGYGLRDMAGNVWEWCRDWYSPVAYFFTSSDPARNTPRSDTDIPFGSERVVRGGSWANGKEMVKVYIRGSQPPSWCTPYLGFRVVLAGR